MLESNSKSIKEYWKNVSQSPKILISTTVDNIDSIKAPKQHKRMISEGSCDTEDWCNDCWKCSFAITFLNILKHKTLILNGNNNSLYYFCCIIWSNKYSLAFKNIFENLHDFKLLMVGYLQLISTFLIYAVHTIIQKT